MPDYMIIKNFNCQTRELRAFLKKYKVDFDERYVWD